MERKLILKDNQAEGQFIIGLRDIQEQSNELLNLFNSLQPWKKITTIEDWLELVSNPEAYYDKTLLANVKLTETSGMQPNPELLAQLFDVPREAFIKIIQGFIYDEEGCKPCKQNKLRIRKGKPCIGPLEFQKYQEFLIFSPKGFTQDEAKVKEHLKSYEKYTQSEDELELYLYWEKLAQLFNYHSKELGLMGSAKLEEACKIFGLKYANSTAYINEEGVYNLIMKQRHETYISK